MKIQLPSQCAQLAGYSMQNLLRHAERSAKAGDDAAYGGDLYLTCSVSHQIHRPLAYAAVYRNPAFVNRNACRLKADGFELPFFQKFFQVAGRFRASLTRSE